MACTFVSGPIYVLEYIYYQCEHQSGLGKEWTAVALFGAQGIFAYEMWIYSFAVLESAFEL